MKTQIKPEDIRKGDLIRCEYAHPIGMSVAQEYIAPKNEYGSGYPARYYLLERPEPPFEPYWGMAIGTYKTTDPNVRIRVVVDEEYPTENPAFPYAPGVLDLLIECYEEGNYYGVILEKATVWTHEKTGDKMRFWDEEESIWSCAGYENVAEEVAKEYFGITVTGRD